MKCRQIQILSPDFVSMKSSPEEVELVKGHLSKCPSCARDVEDMANLVVRLKSVPISGPTEVYWNTLVTRIHERRTRRQAGVASEWILRFLLPGAAATLLVLLAVTAGLQIGAGSGMNLLAVVSSLSTEELQQVTDQTTWNGDVLSSNSDVSNGEYLDDVADLVQLVSNESQASLYSEIDIDDIVSTLDDQEVAQLVSSLQERTLEY
jgi:hypothetical protein